MANPIQQFALRRELESAAAARRRRKSEVGGDDDELLFMSGCPGPVLLLRDLARLLWMYVALFGLLTGGGLVCKCMNLTFLSLFNPSILLHFLAMVPLSDLGEMLALHNPQSKFYASFKL